MELEAEAPDTLVLYDTPLKSRLFLGTASYPSLQILTNALEAAAPGMVTVALRRQGTSAQDFAGQHFLAALVERQLPLLPNTAGCHTVQEALTTAEMAREMLQTNWIKLELIGDDYTLQPDTVQLVLAAQKLVDRGFYVLPYCTEDLVIAKRLVDVGCQVLMPWAAPIGSGQGVINAYGLRLLRERLPSIPMIVDAGLGVPSDAGEVMEWGFDGVLLNTAVAHATFPVRMAHAFSLAVQAGRHAYLAGPAPKREGAQASTPVVGTPFWQQHTEISPIPS